MTSTGPDIDTDTSDSAAAGLRAWQRALRIAQHGEPADLLLRNARIVNVFTGEVEPGNVAIADGRIVGFGSDYTVAHEVVDLDGAFLAPSFIDGHIHTESSLLWVTQFARAVVPRGTGAVITDPHELVNVGGLAAFDAIVNASRDLPLGVHVTVPSCVPASPRESAGAEMTAERIAQALANPAAVGLGEMMNFPGVLAGEADIWDTLQRAAGRRDGHAPGVMGRALDAYALSGISSDHESTTLEEARDKLQRGLLLMIREGSTEHNLHELLPLVNDTTWARCCFASDDRDCATLLHDGHMDATLRLAVAQGLDPVRAIRMATFNVADYWGLRGVGAIAPGYRANLTVLDDLTDFNVRAVYYDGALVARDGKALFDVSDAIPDVLRNTMHVAPQALALDALRLPAPDDGAETDAVGVIDGQIVTRHLRVTPTVVDGAVQADPTRDLLKLVSVERHHATGNVGVGLIQGFGLQRGALASSIAHDAHNIVAVGANDSDLLLAIQAVADLEGGLVAVSDGQVLEQMPLPIAGILSDQPLEQAAAAYGQLEQTARDLGSPLHSPFGLLAFMALSVIPAARVTDQGFMTL